MGSPRVNGNTNSIVREITRGLEKHNVEVSYYYLTDLDINYCRGCKSCYKTGSCVINDDVSKIVDAIFSSRLVIVASPSYWGDITGQMKVFIDRCTPYSNTNNARLRFPSGTMGVAVAVRAGQNRQENLNLVHTIEHFLGHLDIPLVSHFTAEGIDTDEDLHHHQTVLSEAYQFGDELYSIVKEKSGD
jgi:multimeric flavodoxin WrbA